MRNYNPVVCKNCLLSSEQFHCSLYGFYANCTTALPVTLIDLNNERKSGFWRVCRRFPQKLERLARRVPPSLKVSYSRRRTCCDALGRCSSKPTLVCKQCIQTCGIIRPVCSLEKCNQNGFFYHLEKAGKGGGIEA